ncbi:Fucolectin-1, partial [Anabarilius grahami]
ICAVIPAIPAGESYNYSCDGKKGRYVNLIIPGGMKTLTLCELESALADRGLTDVTLRWSQTPKQVIQKANADKRDAHPMLRAAGPRQMPYEPSWLGGWNHVRPICLCLIDRHVIQVSEVVVTNRNDCCAEQINGAEIHIGNSLENNGNNNPIYAVIPAIPAGESYSCSCNGKEGRYVNVILPGNVKTLTLCEVKVYGEENVALWGKISASSNYGKWLPTDAIDGLLTTWAHTKFETDPWWRVDLQKVYRVNRVTITNRNDYAWRINGAVIRIGNFLDVYNNTICGVISTLAASATATFSCGGMEGRYMVVHIPGVEEFLTLCEVGVYGYLAGNRAVGGAASQSSTSSGSWSAEMAIDSNRGLQQLNTSCSSTLNETNPWWRLDLRDVYRVSKVVVTNRNDCCAEQINGAEIRIGNSLENNGSNNPICAVIPAIPAGESFNYSCNGMEGRYVNVYIPGDQKLLHIDFCLHFLENLAVDGSATQSSTSGDWFAEKAVDRGLQQVYTGCSSTLSETNPWWRLDLRHIYRVSKVVVINRNDCCAERINGAEIHIGNSLDNNGSNNPICAVIPDIPAGKSSSYSCNGMEGRYVNLIIPGDMKILTLCEVKVYGEGPCLKRSFVKMQFKSSKDLTDPSTRENVLKQLGSVLADRGYTDVTLRWSQAPKKVIQKVNADKQNAALWGKTTQSSTFGGSFAEFALDGLLGSWTHTNSETNPWWRVDLMKIYRVNRVTITNRPNLGSRINGAVIRVGNFLDIYSNPICGVISSLASGATGTYQCGGMEGGYVVVHIPGGQRMLSICEAGVYGYLAGNRAVGAAASQSSTSGGWSAEKAIDSNRGLQQLNTGCSSTLNQTNPWWRLDLRDVYRVGKVIITNRKDCCAEQINGAEICIGNSLENNGNNNPICAVIPAIPAGESFNYSCNEMEGRYVNLIIPGDMKTLSLCEVKVYGEENLAVDGAATQSSTSGDGFAEKAVDRGLQQVYTGCSSTLTETNPWWRLDLRHIYRISKVVVTNRKDCCAEQINGAEICIGNSLENNGNNNPICAVIPAIPAGESFNYSCNEMEGRYVNLIIPGDMKTLSLCELESALADRGLTDVTLRWSQTPKQVIQKVNTDKRESVLNRTVTCEISCTKENAALWGKPSQSSVYNNHVSGNALDGFPASYTHTNQETNPWWRVDLLKVYRVNRVTITNRATSTLRINGAVIHVGTFLDIYSNPICGVISTLAASATATFSCGGMEGRYVVVHIPGNDKILSLCEVGVYGYLAGSSSAQSPLFPLSPSTPPLTPLCSADLLRVFQSPSPPQHKDPLAPPPSAEPFTPPRLIDQSAPLSLDSTWDYRPCSSTGLPRPSSFALVRHHSACTMNVRHPSAALRPSTPSALSGYALVVSPTGSALVHWHPSSTSDVTVAAPRSPEPLALCGPISSLSSPGSPLPSASSLSVVPFVSSAKPICLLTVGNRVVGGAATQSSTFADWFAEKAIDSNRGLQQLNTGCSSTLKETNPWWRLDLRDVYRISEVILTNRNDNFAEQINEAEIRIGNFLENNGSNNPM